MFNVIKRYASNGENSLFIEMKESKMRIFLITVILAAVSAFPGVCSWAGETISIINFSPSSSQIQFDRKVKTEVSIKQRIEKSVENQGYYSLVVEGPPAKEVYGLLRKFDGATERYGATDVDTKMGENVVCIHAFHRYGFKSEEERDSYSCWFKFGTADNQGGH